MNNVQTQQQRRPAATVGLVGSQGQTAGRPSAATATATIAARTAPLQARVSRGNTSGGGAVIK